MAPKPVLFYLSLSQAPRRVQGPDEETGSEEGGRHDTRHTHICTRICTPDSVFEVAEASLLNDDHGMKRERARGQQTEARTSRMRWAPAKGVHAAPLTTGSVVQDCLRDEKTGAPMHPDTPATLQLRAAYTNKPTRRDATDNKYLKIEEEDAAQGALPPGYGVRLTKVDRSRSAQLSLKIRP
ncbi:hypothetical protein DFH11DRAFT_1553487 [Phellopilus nigrolimitatus]|nr:hypothetical protein DFH11DRAFT_1553487 [Phellopilus nigrolimitatus]